MECFLDNEEKPSFKLSKLVVIVYNDADMEIKVKKVLSHIIWLLQESQNPSQSGEQWNALNLTDKT